MPDDRQMERAPRMQIRLPLRYREVGAEAWQESATDNISRTGVLFASRQDFQAGELVQIDLQLPAVRPISEDGAQFTSLARVVRSIAQTSASDGVSLAVQFLEYQFSRHSTVS
jgi:hypothetical protein